jgi:hypothetical protein
MNCKILVIVGLLLFNACVQSTQKSQHKRTTHEELLPLSMMGVVAVGYGIVKISNWIRLYRDFHSALKRGSVAEIKTIVQQNPGLLKRFPFCNVLLLAIEYDDAKMVAALLDLGIYSKLSTMRSRVALISAGKEVEKALEAFCVQKKNRYRQRSLAPLRIHDKKQKGDHLQLDNNVKKTVRCIHKLSPIQEGQIFRSLRKEQAIVAKARKLLVQEQSKREIHEHALRLQSLLRKRSF